MSNFSDQDLTLGVETSGKLTPPPTGGRDDDDDGGGPPSGKGDIASKSCPRTAGVVIRATVEHLGLAGDTELNVSVKWPATTFSVQPSAKSAAPAAQKTEIQKVPANGPLSDIVA